jgi:nucleotide-binding universal stress UspA family protein
MAFERIVVGVDGSDDSWVAFDAALALAESDGAALTAVHVEYFSAWSSLGLGATLGDVYEADEEIRSQLVKEVTRRTSQGIVLDIVIRKGKPAETLIAVADELEADLVVVGHRGHGGATAFLGSVTNEVVHRSPVSVLVAR